MGGLLPSAISSLSNLVTLDLSHNRIRGAIPSEIGLLSDLKELNLEANWLGETPPAELAQLSNLEKLQLQNNFMKGNLEPVCSARQPGMIVNADCDGEVDCDCCHICCDSKFHCNTFQTLQELDGTQ